MLNTRKYRLASEVLGDAWGGINDVPMYNKHFTLKQWVWLTAPGKVWRVAISGRSATKSTMAAMGFVIRVMNNLEYPHFAAREFGSNVGVSVLKEVSRAVKRFGVESAWDMSSMQPNGGFVHYAGTERNKVGLKGLSDFRSLWFDETESLSTESAENAVPTLLRNNGTEVWLTGNPKLESDWISQEFILGNTSDPRTLLTRFHWSDNPWFNEDENRKRLDYKEKYPHRYGWMWDGEFLGSGSGDLLPHGQWRSLRDRQIEWSDFAGLPVYVGYDLSLSNDHTAFVFMAKSPSGYVLIKPLIFVTKNMLASMPHNMGKQVLKLGHVVEADRFNKIDIEGKVARTVSEKFNQLNVVRCHYDPAFSGPLMEIFNQSHPRIKFQPFHGRSDVWDPVIEDFRTHVEYKAFRHDGNKVMNWHMGNCGVFDDKEDGLLVPDKSGRSGELKIDSAVACMYAFDAYKYAGSRRQSRASYVDNRGEVVYA